MAEFFDLSIPYLEDPKLPSPKIKSLWDSRVRSVARAAELGYAGVTYDRRIRGVAADTDRCRIPPFPIESLLSRAPAIAASATFHRNLLGVNPNSRFCQYTRVTAIVESKIAALSLNSGKELLRSYDIVAARPTTRDAFEILCKTAEVDLISIDFSQKLFPLSLSLVQNAIKRGVYFEVTYSVLIDAGIRRQVLSDLRILVDWTRGKNLVISSSASNANDIKGPYDVANLATFLLGLPMDRAKAAISKNCRCLVATALRKKYCYKEAIRIERFLPDQVQLDMKKVWFNDWNNWDPISSGNGDLIFSEKYSPESKQTGSITYDVTSDIDEDNTSSKDKISLVGDSLNSEDSRGISFWLSKNLESATDTRKECFTVDELLKRNERGNGSDGVPLPIISCNTQLFKCEDDVVLPVSGTKLSNDDTSADTCLVVNNSIKGFNDDVVSNKPRMPSTESEDTIPICDNISDTCLKMSDIIEIKNRFDSCIDSRRNLLPGSDSDKTETTMAVTSVMNVPLGTANTMISEDTELCCSLSLDTYMSNKQADIGQEDCKDMDKLAKILDVVDCCSNVDSCMGDQNLIDPVSNSDKIGTTTVVMNTMNGAPCIAEQRTSEDDRICFHLPLPCDLLGKQVDGRPEYCKQKDLGTFSNCSISEGVLIEQPSEKGQTFGDSCEGNHGDKHELLISMEDGGPVADVSELKNLNQITAAKTCSSAVYHPRTGKRKWEEGYSFVANPLPTKHMLKAVFFRRKEWRLKRPSKHKFCKEERLLQKRFSTKSVFLRYALPHADDPLSGFWKLCLS